MANPDTLLVQAARLFIRRYPIVSDYSEVSLEARAGYLAAVAMMDVDAPKALAEAALPDVVRAIVSVLPSALRAP